MLGVNVSLAGVQPQQALKATPMRGTLQVESCLGGGGFGTVYKVKGQPLAVKMVVKRRGGLKKPRQLATISKMTNKEANALHTLSHPNIVKLTQFLEGSGSFLLVMELASGGTLAELGKLAEPVARPILRQVTDAVAYCHSQGVIHRDLKPENIVFTDASHKTIKLVDFGVAKITTPASPRLLKGRWGTPGYIAPEMLFKKSLINMWPFKKATLVRQSYEGAPVDAFSLGIVFMSTLADCYGGTYNREGWVERPTLRGSQEVRAIMAGFLHHTPSNRLKPAQAMQLPYFAA